MQIAVGAGTKDSFLRGRRRFNGAVKAHNRKPQLPLRGAGVRLSPSAILGTLQDGTWGERCSDRCRIWWPLQNVENTVFTCMYVPTAEKKVCSLHNGIHSIHTLFDAFNQSPFAILVGCPSHAATVPGPPLPPHRKW